MVRPHPQAFSQFGRILEIVALRGDKMRGQAWVSFDSVDSATSAMAQLNGQPFFDKPLRIAYAKSKSDTVAKRDGTYKPREKRAQEKAAPMAASLPPPVAATPAPAAPMVRHRWCPGLSPSLSLSPAPHVARVSLQEVNMTPSQILFAQNLPKDCSSEALTMLFQNSTGFSEVRLVPGKEGIAFVEFDDEYHAAAALQAFNGFKLTPTESLALTYAKR